jgi:mannose-6-phosphate isomerase-like protein (cupin superfamily)
MRCHGLIEAARLSPAIRVFPRARCGEGRICDSYGVAHAFGSLDELGDGPGFRKVRTALGVEAFGINWIELPPGAEGHEHDHAEQNEEEVYFVVRGGGSMRIDGEEIELKPGRFVRVDPSSTRMPVAGDEGLEFLTIGAPLEGGYEPPSWG